MVNYKKKIYDNEEIINKKLDNLRNDLENLKEQINSISNILSCSVLDSMNFISSNLNNNILVSQNQLKFQNIELLPYAAVEKNKNPKVLLCGFYGAPNLGDELMLETLLNYIPKNIELTIMLAENSNYDITSFPKCHFIHYPKNMLDINQIAEYFDTIIFGGGALIDDVTFENPSIQMPLGWVLVNLGKRALILKKKVLLLGLSCSNKLEDKKYIDKLNYVLSNAQYVSLRDKYSFDYLSKFVDTSKVIISNDIVFANSNIILNKILPKKASNNIGLIMICSNENVNLIINIINQIKEIYGNKKFKISLIPFYDYNNYDCYIYNKVIEKCPDINIEVIDYTNSSIEICNIIDNQDFIISMRYHGTLISLLRNKKVMSIIYDIHCHYSYKMNYLYDHYKFNNISINYSELSKEKLKENLNKLFNCQSKKYDILKYHNETIKELKTTLNKITKDVK